MNMILRRESDRVRQLEEVHISEINIDVYVDSSDFDLDSNCTSVDMNNMNVFGGVDFAE